LFWSQRASCLFMLLVLPSYVPGLHLASFETDGANIAVSNQTGSLDNTIFAPPCFVDQVKTSELKLTDLYQTRVINQTYTARQVMIQAVVKNDCKVDNYPFLEILEVRDMNGYSRPIVIFNSTINAGDNIQIGGSWVPEESGNYVVRAFTVTCPNCLGILAPDMRLDITVHD